MRTNIESSGITVITTSNNYDSIVTEREKLETLQKEHLGDPKYGLYTYSILDTLNIPENRIF